ncbi:MAG TPA: alpha/beta fold hydrolase [Nannocystis exedens]|nr:alpha/beta fold hydrolase [Nannocystis exedens]
MQRLPAPPIPEWLSALLPPQIRRFTARVGDHDLHVMELGRPGPRPSIVMLHGNPSWGFLYRKVAEQLALDNHIILPDLVGLGLSEKPPSANWHTLERHAQVIAALLSDLDLGKIVFVGQDWGGPIGLLSMSQEPGQCAGLVLMNTVVGPPMPGFRPSAIHRISHLPLVSDFAFRTLGLPQRMLNVLQGDRRSIRGDVARAYRYPLRHRRDRAGPLGLARMVPSSLYHPSMAALERSQQFVEDYQGPAALVWGERDPLLGRLLRRVHRALPQAEVSATQAGHFLQEEVPAKIAAAIRGVLAKSQEQVPA